jgi:hypothetical protein
MERWKEDWRQIMASIGQDFGDGSARVGADLIEAGAVRRMLEPLEFDCPLHYDRQAARAAGYADIVCPYTFMLTFTMAPLWRPGDVLFDSHARDAQPRVSLGRMTERLGLPARYSGYFATDVEIEFYQVAMVGERLGRRGFKLLSCEPKETSVGRGAFTMWETEFFNQRDEVAAHMRSGVYVYEPKGGRPS